MYEVAWKLQKSEVREAPPTLIGPETAARLATTRIGSEPVEVAEVYLLNTRNRVIGVEAVARGSINGTLLPPREVYCAAVHARAAGIVVAHNHPSGNVSPSREDLALCERLRQAGSILGIELLDFLIVSHTGKSYSFKERGML